MSLAIECQQIKKHYGEGESLVEALRGIDLQVRLGELTLLVGPSGSGKTTLLSIITNILTPSSGKFFLLGQDMEQLDEENRSQFCRTHLGMVFQSLYLIPSLSVLENVTLPLVIAGLSHEESVEKAFNLLESMGIGHKQHMLPKELSKGQQQRVAIARAMINDPNILICDEPTSALDQASGQEVMTLLKEKVGQEKKRAVLVVTHDPRTFPFADTIIHMNDGQISTNAPI